MRYIHLQLKLDCMPLSNNMLQTYQSDGTRCLAKNGYGKILYELHNVKWYDSLDPLRLKLKPKFSSNQLK